jgi:dienelactone hydrolase
MTTSLRRRLSLVSILSLLAASLILITSPAEAQTIANPATSGPFSVSTSNVSSFVSGFGGGTIYYPSSSGSYGGMAVSPGYTASSSSMSWYGNRMASHGFVAIVIDTNSRYDQPNSRGTQLLAALDWLTASSPSAVRGRLDSTRLAVAGHSMGGGGSIAASNSRSSLKASNPLTPWHTTKTWSNNQVPQLIVGAQNDSVASVSSHAIPLYNGIPSTTPKMYVELRGASHFAPNSTNADISRMAVSWMKRWVDGDTRYNVYLCGSSRPTVSTTWSDVRDNCSLGWGTTGTTTTAPSGTCVRSSNQTHVNNDRAVSIFGLSYARGSGTYIGLTSYLVFSSLREIGPNYWVEVSSC